MRGLEGKVYVVTGASRGFGLAIARALVEAGARVGVIGRDPDKLAAAASELGAANALALELDITRHEGIAPAFATVRDHFGQFDGLVNNAGLARPAAIDEMDPADVALQLQTNIIGTVFCTQAALPLLAGSDNPRIVNISSASAGHHDEMSHLSIYAASKAAVERFSRDLRRELQEQGVGVTILRPGGAWTEFSAGWDLDKTKRAITAWSANTGPGMDSGMTPDDVARAVVFCLETPPGVSVDLLEIRPNRRIPKVSW